ASGICLELKKGAWVPVHATAGHARGAARAYRWACLQDVLPLPERMGWDALDGLKAATRGWRTATVPVPFRHHRKVGARDANQWQTWLAGGERAYYMNYRPLFLVLRTMRHALVDIRAIAMVAGFTRAAVARAPRHSDPDVRSLVRDRQRLRTVPLRAAESLGYRRQSR